MSGFTLLMWTTVDGHIPRGVIYFMTVWWLVGNELLVYLVYVSDTSADTPHIKSAPMVRQFVDVFPTNIPSFPPDHDIDFCIDIEPGMKRVSILPY